MKEAINNDRQADRKARAKRSDITAMQERFDAIMAVMKGWTDAGGDLPIEQATVVYKIAMGNSLDDIVQEAGRRALGLEPPVGGDDA